jgi:hypothetical protein
MSTWKTAGPLTTSAIALFGNGSWLSTAANYMSNRTYNDTNYDKFPWQLMCLGMPFGKLWPPGTDSFPDYMKDDFVSRCGWDNEQLFERYETREQNLLDLTHQFLSAFAPVDTAERSLNNTQSLLEIAMFVANRAMLTVLSPEVGQGSYDLTGRKIYTSPGVTIQRPVLSKTALTILSVLLGLQLLGLGYLTYYLYRFPTWSDKLDAMAMARIGASLEQREVLPPIGPVSKERLNALQYVGGLIGIVEKAPHRESSMTRLVSPESKVGDASDIELRQLTATEEARTSAEDDTSEVQLGLGASGPIFSTSTPRRSPYAGLKRVWTETYGKTYQQDTAIN